MHFLCQSHWLFAFLPSLGLCRYLAPVPALDSRKIEKTLSGSKRTI